MTPASNILIAVLLLVIVLPAAAVKLLRPASTWHRRLGRLALIPAAAILFGMVHRAWIFQASFQMLQWWHSVAGGLSFFLLFMKLLATRRLAFTATWIRPLGYGTFLFLLFPGGWMVGQYALHARAWSALGSREILWNPDQSAFDVVCLRCHNRETALEGLGTRSVAEWISLVEPMAWAGGLQREETRGALAAILAPSSTVPPGIHDHGTAGHHGAPGQDIPGAVSASGTDAKLPLPTLVGKYCIQCHGVQRTLSLHGISREEFRKIVHRMRGHATHGSGLLVWPETESEAIIEELVNLIGPRRR